jgi:hypothetical protein
VSGELADELENRLPTAFEVLTDVIGRDETFLDRNGCRVKFDGVPRAGVEHGQGPGDVADASRLGRQLDEVATGVVEDCGSDSALF